jgi:hypothetical protein
MDEQVKNIYLTTGFAFPGMSNKELDNVINEIPLQKDNIEKYKYPQNLYELQLQRKAEIQFRKPATVDSKVLLMNGSVRFW